jgi:hypothetical protein
MREVLVHVWKGNDYVAKVRSEGLARASFRIAPDTEDSRKVSQLLLGHDWMKIQMYQDTLGATFPSDDWHGFAALLLLPPLGTVFT